MGYVDETRKKEKIISEIISSEDLLNIGLSKYYVTTILDRIKEYKKEDNKHGKTV